MPAGSAVFSSAYAGSVDYYAAMCRCGMVTIDPNEKAGKHSRIHNHCRIIGPNGQQTLAIPIEHATRSGESVVRDIRIAEHGGWRRVHWGAIFSAYGRTPFFEYIAPELQALYNRGDCWLFDFNMALHELIVEFLDLPIITMVGGDSGGNRGLTSQNQCRPYHQIWADRFGFVPGLSILDLLMNVGREAILAMR